MAESKEELWKSKVKTGNTATFTELKQEKIT